MPAEYHGRAIPGLAAGRFNVRRQLSADRGTRRRDAEVGLAGVMTRRVWREGIPSLAARTEVELRRNRLMRVRHHFGLRSFRGNRLRRKAVPGERRPALVSRHARRPSVTHSFPAASFRCATNRCASCALKTARSSTPRSASASLCRRGSSRVGCQAEFRLRKPGEGDLRAAPAARRTGLEGGGPTDSCAA